MDKLGAFHHLLLVLLSHAVHKCMCGAGGVTDEAASGKSKGLATWVIILIAVVATALVVMGLLVVLCCYLHRMRKREHASYVQVQCLF